MAEGTIRQLFKQLPGGGGVFQYTAGVIDDTTVTGEGWEYIEQDSAELPMLVNRTYIDLAGYTLQDLTLFTQAVDFQKNTFASAFATSGAAPLSITQYDLISTRALTSDELEDIGGSPPGFLPSTLDLMEVVYGEQVTSLQNSNIPGAFVPTYSDTFGSGNPTASDRLHWTRIFIVTPGASPQVQDIGLNVPPCNLVIGALTLEEQELVYIERLRRAYTQERP